MNRYWIKTLLLSLTLLFMGALCQAPQNMSVNVILVDSEGHSIANFPGVYCVKVWFGDQTREEGYEHCQIRTTSALGRLTLFFNGETINDLHDQYLAEGGSQDDQFSGYMIYYKVPESFLEGREQAHYLAEELGNNIVNDPSRWAGELSYGIVLPDREIEEVIHSDRYIEIQRQIEEAFARGN